MRRTLLPVVLVAPLLLAAAPASATAPTGPARVTAVLETPALYDDEAGGDADVDDPAIWIHPTDPARTRVIVTAKNGGLYVYDLRGHQTQHFATPAAPGPDDESGRFNNVDLVSGFRLAGRTVDLAVVTDRGRDKLRFYRIDDGTLTDVTAASAPFAFNRTQAEVNEQATAYGLATYRTGDDWYAVASRRHTPELGMFRLIAVDGKVTYRRTDSLTLPASFRLPNGTTWTPCLEPGEGPQVEGMTVDPVLGTLYAAQEDVALWRVQVVAGRFGLWPSQVERVREFGVPATYDPETEECDLDWAADPGYGGRIAADVEGVTIYRTGLLTGTLIVSSQGDDTFYTYDRLTNRKLTQFAVVDGAVDGSQECDGAAVVSTPLPGFPGGLLVVQDGHETPDSDRTATNVKFLDAGFLRR
ncbi:3-phytase [Allocatelliglobosispora scoriae]|uniref:3-phytase n=1 Tax=Allocatelliglobosispora scoriae TaxID=643052 RepID=A0A841BL65_9ACTN|nr:phytase [Allocatelliglobosispora scoriae]MBB5867939.1 3-phytase [Allocatelliglobosispora scoriae]